MPALTLVRHAQPLLAGGICYGALDVPANPQATGQAAQRLALQLAPNAVLLASPLQRCQQLARALRQLRPDLSCRTEPRLTEINFGVYEGQAWADIPTADYQAWLADFWHYRFGGAENTAEFMARVASVWDQLAQLDPTPVWLTHAGVIRAASLLAQGQRQLDSARQWPRAAPAFGQSLQLKWPVAALSAAASTA